MNLSVLKELSHLKEMTMEEVYFSMISSYMHTSIFNGKQSIFEKIKA